MIYKAIIFDLDNTIYPVHSIADELFSDLFQLLDSSGEAPNDLEKMKEEVKRKPFQRVAAQYGLSDKLTKEAIALIKTLSIKGPMTPFDDYGNTRDLPVPKFLVTSGFTALQYSKVEKLGIEKDFVEIHVVDPEKTTATKKDVFANILKRYHFPAAEVLVVGDDPESEIKAALELGMKVIWYDKSDRNNDHKGVIKISDFSELKALVDNQ